MPITTAYSVQAIQESNLSMRSSAASTGGIVAGAQTKPASPFSRMLKSISNRFSSFFSRADTRLSREDALHFVAKNLSLQKITQTHSGYEFTTSAEVSPLGPSNSRLTHSNDDRLSTLRNELNSRKSPCASADNLKDIDARATLSIQLVQKISTPDDAANFDAVSYIHDASFKSSSASTVGTAGSLSGEQNIAEQEIESDSGSEGWSDGDNIFDLQPSTQIKNQTFATIHRNVGRLSSDDVGRIEHEHKSVRIVDLHLKTKTQQPTLPEQYKRDPDRQATSSLSETEFVTKCFKYLEDQRKGSDERADPDNLSWASGESLHI